MIFLRLHVLQPDRDFGWDRRDLVEPGVSGVIAVDVWYVSMIVVDVFPATRKYEKLLRQRRGWLGLRAPCLHLKGKRLSPQVPIPTPRTDQQVKNDLLDARKRLRRSLEIPYLHWRLRVYTSLLWSSSHTARGQKLNCSHIPARCDVVKRGCTMLVSSHSVQKIRRVQ